ncbi:MAG: GDSL-type esterase/lipase family protein [Agathobacter sp.]|nr:GDSL-type esterase/lipase family protein [Agathobacter sp.]
MESTEYTKWVACWGNATSITDQKEAMYAKNITLRYPIRMVFDGCALRLHFSNLTGTEPVTLSKVYIEQTTVTFDGEKSVLIEPGKEVTSDEIAYEVKAGTDVNVSVYLGEITQMNAGVLITGPLSKGQYAYGNHALEEELPADDTRNTNWFYFLNTVDVLTKAENHAFICYGDSITAQSWPDDLAIRLWNEGIRNVAIIRRAVSGTRILRQYDCITYAAYGLKGATRFPIEMEVAGADAVLIQHGINDIIHPVGVEVNQFRPWSDMPTSADLIAGVEDIYIRYAKEKGYRVYGGTLLPIYGWRTYAPFREEIKNEFNHWIRTTDKFDGYVDFDEAVRDENHPEAFAEGNDSGDHLHPSEKAYEIMAGAIPAEWFF